MNGAVSIVRKELGRAQYDLRLKQDTVTQLKQELAAAQTEAELAEDWAAQLQAGLDAMDAAGLGDS